MKSLLTVLLCCVIVVPVIAGERDKNKQVKPTVTPSERIDQLLETLKNDRKEEHRSKAAEELGTLASSEYPEIVSGLIDALVRDEASSVRKTVIRSLAAIDPATHEVKDALDQAVKSDKSWTVRQAARLAVWRYKPKDEPQQVPGPKLRNTSKPGSSGNMPISKDTAKAKAGTTKDPLKTMPMPQVPVPVVPAVPAPTMAPAPGLFQSQQAPSSITDLPPARLTAPKRSGD